VSHKIGERVMTVDKFLNLASAIAGAVGTLLMYRGTFGLQSVFTWTSQAMAEETAGRNRQRLRFQRCGLALLTTSLLLQIVALFA
jgi:hypothetical protein